MACKFFKQKKQVSYDDGVTWVDVTPAEYQKGELYEYDSADCPDPIDYSKEYLTFIPTTGSSTFGFVATSGNSVEYSLDSGATWMVAGSPTVSAGQKIMWRGNCVPQTSDNYPQGIGKFTATDKFIVEGNTMSLFYGDNFQNQTSLSGKNHALRSLFNNNTNIVDAENMILPATTISEWCYYGMFSYCSGLTSAPSLPATTLGQYCYCNMFNGCESLTVAPELPATTLVLSCYQKMFNYCTSLIASPILSASTLANQCYQQMFNYCTSLNSVTCLATNISATNCTDRWVDGVSASGTFTKASSMTSWVTGSSGIPNGWVVQNYNY